MPEQKIIIVNEQDEVIDVKERNAIGLSDIYRVSALWIENTKGDVLLAQRAFTKDKSPGKWGPAVAGTLEEGETYESNIIKEAEEEIGLTEQAFQKSDKVRYTGKYNYFCQWFKLTIDRDVHGFTLQEEELEQLKWFTKDVLRAALQKNPEDFLTSVKERMNLSSA